VKPKLIYDGECGYCLRWIKRWKAQVADQIEFHPSQSLVELPPGTTPKDFKNSVVFIDRDGSIARGAEAVFKTLAFTDRGSVSLKLSQNVPGFAPVSEAVYRVVAGHRPFFSRLTKWMTSSQK
jgi:lipase maturation factor 1